MKAKMFIVSALAVAGLLSSGCAHHRKHHSCGCGDKAKAESCGKESCGCSEGCKDHKEGKCTAGATEAAPASATETAKPKK